MNEQAFAYGGIPQQPTQQEDTILQRRWESADLIDSLWLLLAGKERYSDNGQIKLRDSPGVKALMNQEGASRVIQVVRSGFVNPVMSLSSLADEDARTLFYASYTSLIEAIVLNQTEWGVNSDADLKIIHATLLPLLFAQVMRPVNGFEARNTKPQISENTGSINSTTETRGGFKIPGFGGNK